MKETKPMEVARRPAIDSDGEFVRETHHLAYRDVIVRVYGRWDEQVQDEYFMNWVPVAFDIVMCEGQPCGYMRVEVQPQNIHIEELVIHPHFQNQGIGSFLLRQVMKQAEERLVPVRLRTHHSNRALRLYQRFGFEEFDRTDTHTLLQWKPPSDNRGPFQLKRNNV